MMAENTEPVPVALAKPAGWSDKTMIVYSAPLAEGESMAANIVVARDALAAGEDLLAFGERQLRTFQAGLPGYRLITREAGSLHGRQAIRIELEWRSAAGSLRQLATFVQATATGVVTFTGSAAADDFDRHRTLFEEQLLRLRIGADA